MALTPVFLPGKCHRQRSLVGYSSKGYKELDTTEHIHTHKTRRGILLTVIISVAGRINYSSSSVIIPLHMLLHKDSIIISTNSCMKLNGKDREEDGQYVKVLQAKRIYKDTVALVSITGH